METHHGGRVNSAAHPARLLKQVKPAFGLLTTVRIGPPSGFSRRATRRTEEFTPRRQSSPVAVRKMG